VAVELGTAFRAWSSYKGTPPATRAFLAARLVIVPLGELARELEGLEGRVLSLGSGYGIVERYLSGTNAHVTVRGLELDAERVRVAASSQGRWPRVSVVEVDLTRLEEPEAYDAALAVDVIHHIPQEQHESIARALHRCLRPGGICLVKEIATRPRWQYRWNRLHDRLVAGPEPIHCRSPEEMAGLFEAAGFELRSSRRLARLQPYPHYLLRLEKHS
jgi:cyclopropane fatty-acyl-phospholipid synthase-like methyltransferase